jgi:hypothetical protein
MGGHVVALLIYKPRADDASGRADRCRTGRHARQHHGPAADFRPVADLDVAEDRIVDQQGCFNDRFRERESLLTELATTRDTGEK